jgi:hypothetical protein
VSLVGKTARGNSSHIAHAKYTDFQLVLLLRPGRAAIVVAAVASLRFRELRDKFFLQTADFIPRSPLSQCALQLWQPMFNPDSALGIRHMYGVNSSRLNPRAMFQV